MAFAPIRPIRPQVQSAFASRPHAMPIVPKTEARIVTTPTRFTMAKIAMNVVSLKDVTSNTGVRPRNWAVSEGVEHLAREG